MGRWGPRRVCAGFLACIPPIPPRNPNPPGHPVPLPPCHFSGWYNTPMNLDAALDLLAMNPDAPLDVAELALHLARDEYPDLDVEAYLKELDGMAHEARTYLRGDLEARVGGLCRYLFHE